jgi:hypothetical protein
MTTKEQIEPYENAERALTEQVYNIFNVEYFNFSNPDARRPWDSTYKLKESDPSIFVEVKVRNFNINKYEDFILETAKLKSLTKIQQQGNPTEYWNFYRNDLGFYDLIIFKLTKRINEWTVTRVPVQQKYMQYQTFTQNDNKVMKEIVMLKFERGNDAKFENKGWYLQN